MGCVIAEDRDFTPVCLTSIRMRDGEQGNRQRQEQLQIPFGDDNKKSNGKSKYKSDDKYRSRFLGFAAD
jgi:hypothetical protein